MMAYNALAQSELDARSDSVYSCASTSPFDHKEAFEPTCPELESRSRATRSDMMEAPRTVSREGSVLRHPTPDLQSLQGAYVGNVERLEESAERLSLSSDIEEELRKIKMEQRRSESRRSSALSSPIEPEGRDPSLNLHRQTSYGYGTHASNSIVSTNNVARSGGFSPAAYFASPRNSVRSGSQSHQSSVKGSASYGTRLTQVSEPEQEGKPLDSPLSTRFVPTIPQPEPLANALRGINDGQFNLYGIGTPHTEAGKPEFADQESEPRRSSDTFRQANGLFADFDGVHSPQFNDQHDEPDNIDRTISTYPPPTSRSVSYVQPTSADNMVYYPAPVPMMLNLPKRLSRLPAAPHRDKRRSEMLDGLPKEARKSAPWLPDMLEDLPEGSHQDEDDRSGSVRDMKRRTMADLPPQLRATMFFDQPAVRQDVELKGESAVATLDSILDASAFAPVTAFTDHPIVGQLGADVYRKAPVKPRNITPTEANSPGKKGSSMNLLTKRRSSSNVLEQSNNRSSIALLSKRDSSSALLEDNRKRNSLMNLGNYLGKRNSSAQTPMTAAEYDEVEAAEMHGEEAPLQDHNDDNDATNFHEESEEPEQLDGEERESDYIGQPTTLLAELQMRKQQQKQRNRTAATAFPDGMHSTLLQLDAVAQVQKQARMQKRTQLAWEDPDVQQPGNENEDDEDVPLGMLFPKHNMDAIVKSRRLGENRPTGLLARRDMEDNEPLSHRRARLRGEDPPARTASPDKRNSMYTLDPLNFEDTNIDPQKNDEEGSETLGQRIRRLKATQIPHQTRPVSGDFASEMMSQLGVTTPTIQPSERPEPQRTTTKTPDIFEEETLGQRRKRLQAEATRNTSGDSNGAPARPPMATRRSMADLLQAHPAAGAGAGAPVRVFSNEVKFAPPPKTRNTTWAMNQTMQASTGQWPMASGFGTANGFYPNGTAGLNAYANGEGYHPHPIMGQQPVEPDLRQRDMIDRWRQSVMQ
ncbi:hypothetical protein N7G274_006347 [Stereocaulon virgatum]|uniref:Uncharacterized protein n=1 Tax=Stereocaulon virgatum TaxID=373712 RepID=A0ABR4A4P6_9LECA